MIWTWISEGDGFIIAICAFFVITFVANIFVISRFNMRLVRCEFRVQGFHEKIMAANEQATRVGQELRRVTGNFDNIIDEELSSAATRIRNRVKPTDDES